MDYSVFMGDPPRVCDGPPDVMAKISVSPKEVQYKGFLVHLVRGLQLFWWMNCRIPKSGHFYCFSDFDQFD